MTTQTRRTSAQRILEIIQDLHRAEQVVTREVLSVEAGVSLGIVDEHVKNLINDGSVKRVKNGVFQPIEQLPPSRPVSVTYLDSGIVKVERGDDVLDLTPREARQLGASLSGHALAFSQIQIQHELGTYNAQNDMLIKLSRRAAELEEGMAAMQKLLQDAKRKKTP